MGKGVPFSSAFEVHGLALLLVEDTEDSGQFLQVDPFVEVVVGPIGPSVPGIGALALPDIGGDVGDGYGDIGLEWIADESVLLLLLQGFGAVLVGLLSDYIFGDGGVN